MKERSKYLKSSTLYGRSGAHWTCNIKCSQHLIICSKSFHALFHIFLQYIFSSMPLNIASWCSTKTTICVKQHIAPVKLSKIPSKLLIARSGRSNSTETVSIIQKVVPSLVKTLNFRKLNNYSSTAVWGSRFYLSPDVLFCQHYDCTLLCWASWRCTCHCKADSKGNVSNNAVFPP